MQDKLTRQDLQIDFMSLVQLERSTGRPDWAVISITDSDQSAALIPTGYGHSLKLSFDDLDTDAIHQGSTGVPFEQEDAQIVWGFIKKIGQDPTTHGLIVQCEAGRSRSAAIAIFASAVLAGRFVTSRRVDGFNDLVLSALEKVSAVRVSRPRSTTVEPDQVIERALR